jgi:nucleotide-binding universal stress UspA family protein
LRWIKAAMLRARLSSFVPAGLKSSKKSGKHTGEIVVSTYASIMVALDLGPDVVARIKLAADLADRVGARLIGAAARQPVVAAIAEAPFAAGMLVEEDRRFASEELREVETVFRDAVGSRDRIAFRSAFEMPTFFLAGQARAADLLVVGRQGRDDHDDWRFAVDPGDLALGAGRPILVAPPKISVLSAKRVVIAWKDAREARRAVRDALPLLKAADEVLVVAVGESGRAGALDVKEHLDGHGINARTLVQARRESAVADDLIRAAEREGADLMVAGAYGHSRTREWILGGVTRDLLDHAPIPCLLAH